MIKEVIITIMDYTSLVARSSEIALLIHDFKRIANNKSANSGTAGGH